MKYLSIIFLFLIIHNVFINGENSTSSDNTCTFCKSIGEPCILGLHQCFYPETKCLVVNGKPPACVSLPDLYGDCTETKECKNNYFCNEGKCERHEYLGYSELCRTSDDCSQGLSCEATCANVHYPSCNLHTQCKYNEYCNDRGKCVELLGNGDSCNITESCPRYSKCINGSCIPPMNSLKGEPCMSTLDCDISVGLACFNNICIDMANTVMQCNMTNPQCPHLSMCDCQDDYSILSSNSSYIYDATPNTQMKNNGTNKMDGVCKMLIDLTQSSKSHVESFVHCVRNDRCPMITKVQPASCQSKCGLDPFDEMTWYACQRHMSSSNSIKYSFYLLFITIFICLF